MGFATTVLSVTTAGVVVLSPTSTWADSAGATLYDAVPLVVVNESTSVPVRLAGSTAQTGIPLRFTGNMSFTVLRSDTLVAFTTAAGSTAALAAMAGRQNV